MAVTGVMGMTLLEVSQALKEITTNEALATLDKILGLIEVTDASGTKALTEDEGANGIIRITSTLTNDLLVTIPARYTAGWRLIVNESTGSFAVDLQFVGGAASVEVPQGAIVVFLDGEIITISQAAETRYGAAIATFGLAGSGTPVAVGDQRFIPIPKDVTIYRVDVYADQAATADFDVFLGDYAGYPASGSIVAAAPPALAAADQSTDSTLTGWTLILDRLDHLIVECTSNDLAEELRVVFFWEEN